MLFFPNVKINLGLNVVSKRPDGYHNLVSVFIPLALADCLEITFPTDSSADYVWQSSGIDVGAEPEKNLCIKALRQLQGCRNLPCVGMHLHKAVPTGAGLGGGSSDGVAVLKGLNDLLRLGLSNDELRALALKLGADCPFFVDNKPAFVTGIGEVLEPFAVPQLAGYQVVLVKPNVFVSTAEAYAGIVPKAPAKDLRVILSQDVSTWKTELVNDFEESVFAGHPVISDVKRALYDSGATYAQMSGSGSAVFGLFAPGAQIPTAEQFPGMFFWHGDLGVLS